jgi:hypothetical protein
MRTRKDNPRYFDDIYRLFFALQFPAIFPRPVNLLQTSRFEEQKSLSSKKRGDTWATIPDSQVNAAVCFGEWSLREAR